MSLSSHNGHTSNRVEVLQRVKLFLHPLFVESPLKIMKTVTLLDEITFIIKGSQSHLLIPYEQIGEEYDDFFGGVNRHIPDYNDLNYCACCEDAALPQ